MLELHGAAGHGGRREAWENAISKVWKLVRLWHKSPKALGKLQELRVTKEAQSQNSHVGST